MKNYLSERFFFGRFHLVFHIVYFSTREIVYNNVFLKFCKLWNGISFIFFSIESPKIIVVGAFVLVFLLNMVFPRPCLNHSYYSLMSSCKISQRFVEEKSFLVSAFFIFDDFRGVWNWYSRLSLVLPVLFSLLLLNGLSCLTSFNDRQESLWWQHFWI